MYYTTKQVLKFLNISKPTLYRICKKKKIKPQKTAGGNYRFSEQDLNRIFDNECFEIDIEKKFVKTSRDIWLMLKGLAEEIWGIENGEQKLKTILEKNKDIFILNESNFKETKNA